MELDRKGAIISACEKYRYLLYRTVNIDAPSKTCLFIMLNPSTADGSEDDPTIRRCMGYAKDWGYQRLEVINLFSYRTTDPGRLKKAADVFGPDHEHHVNLAIKRSSLIICGWGSNNGFRPEIGKAMYLVIKLWEKESMCLKQNKDGSPAHPLYLRKTLQPLPILA